MCCEQRRRRARRAFSLVEVMIVIVIIGLLAGVVTINVRAYLLKAKQNAARHEIATIVTALDTYFGACGNYPSNDEGLAILAGPSETFPEPLLKHEPVDPWGRPYQYNSPGTHGNEPYEVVCYGEDGREGGEGADQDIRSDELRKPQRSD